MGSRTIRIASVALLLACGDTDRRDDEGADAGPGDGGAGFSPDPPEPPLPPRIAPCPDGWRDVPDEDDEDGVSACDPWPATGRATCAGDEAHFPGEPGCRPIGSACPAGDFADDLPAANVVHVLAGAADGGDGSRARPFSRIAQGVAAARSGDVVALSRGTFDETVALPGGVTLWGACIAESVVASSVAGTASATVTLFGDGATVRNLRISGERPGLDVNTTGADDAVAESILIDGTVATGVAVFVSAGLVARDLVVRGTRASGGELGYALQATDQARVDLTRAVFEGNQDAGFIVADPGTTLVARDLAVQGTLPRASDRRRGYGMHVFDGGEATLERVAVGANTTAGVAVSGKGARLAATDLVVEDTEEQESDGTGGHGLDVFAGATASVSRVRLSRNHGVGTGAQDSGTLVQMTDAVIEDVRPGTSDPASGMGLHAIAGARVEIERVVLRRNAAFGAGAMGAGSVLVATDVAVRDTAPAAGEGGFGFQVVLGARIEVTRVSAERSAGVALFLEGDGAAALGTDVSLIETLATADSPGGVGIQVIAATIDLDRVSIDGSQLAGILTVGLQADLVFADLAIRGTRVVGEQGGTGIVVIDGAHVGASRFLLSENELCGIQLAGGQMDLSLGEVSHNAIGANIQTPGFDLDRIRRDVAWIDNTRNLDTAQLPVPEPAAEL